MPVVVVEMWEGRTEQQKERLIRGISNVFKDLGVPAEQTTVIIHDIPKSSWGARGEQASKS